MKKAFTLVGLLLVALLLLAGCGGGAETQAEEDVDGPGSEEVQQEEPAEEVAEEVDDSADEAAEEEESGEEEAAGDSGELVMPDDLTSAHDFNKFATDLMIEKVPASIFSAPVFSEEEKEEARKALVLIIEAYDRAIEIYDQNEHIFFNRGRAYKLVYLDTEDPSYKEKALADLNKALEMGLSMAQNEIDTLQD